MNPHRHLERDYAQRNGYFWLPCSLCGQEYGGHEWIHTPGVLSSIRDAHDPTLGHAICPDCTHAGRGEQIAMYEFRDT
jgi:hypothetical protein